jgi:hypothetical protein
LIAAPGYLLAGDLTGIDSMDDSDRVRSSMSSSVYIVLKSGDRWWVDYDGRPSGPFETEEEAHAAAMARATTFGDPSHPAEIYAPGPDGRFRLVFSRPSQSKAS